MPYGAIYSFGMRYTRFRSCDMSHVGANGAKLHFPLQGNIRPLCCSSYFGKIKNFADRAAFGGLRNVGKRRSLRKAPLPKGSWQGEGLTEGL